MIHVTLLMLSGHEAEVVVDATDLSGDIDLLRWVENKKGGSVTIRYFVRVETGRYRETVSVGEVAGVQDVWPNV
jgi:hypothetical protein